LQGRCGRAAVAVVGLAFGVHKRRQAKPLDRIAASSFAAGAGFRNTLCNALKAGVSGRGILRRAYACGGAFVAFNGVGSGDKDGYEKGDLKKLHSWSSCTSLNHTGRSVFFCHFPVPTYDCTAAVTRVGH